MRKLTSKTPLLREFKAFVDPTEDMSKRELSVALSAIIKKLKIDNSYDVPYLAGYSKDGKTIYIDKRVPKFLDHKKKKFNIFRFLILHEIVEKSLIDHLGHLNYLLAHQIASRAEYAAIEGEQLDYKLYNRVIQAKLAEIRDETNYRIPPDLDLKPYFDAHEKTLIDRIKKSLKIKWHTPQDEKFKINKHPHVIRKIIKPHGKYPNNKSLPLLIYKHALAIGKASPNDIRKFLKKHNWKNSWIDSIYKYNHYHSNTHEALVIFSGNCLVQLGGDNGIKYHLTTGDVIIFPAGLAHKSLTISPDFKCIGAYPSGVKYDMNYGLLKENSTTQKNIKTAKFPSADPIYGMKGPLFRYWKRK